MATREWARETVGTDDGSGPCQACGEHLAVRMEECPHCGFDANLGSFAARAGDERIAMPAPTMEALRRARALKEQEEDAAIAEHIERTEREARESLDAMEAEREERECEPYPIGVDLDGMGVWRDPRTGDEYNSGEPLTENERRRVAAYNRARRSL